MSADKSVALRWQDFRLRCVELAISGGAQGADIVSRAEEIGKYIVTRSELEKSIPSEEVE